MVSLKNGLRISAADTVENMPDFIRFKLEKRQFIPQYLFDRGLKGTVLNGTWPSLIKMTSFVLLGL